MESTTPTAPTTLTIDDGDSSPHCDPNLPPLDERVLGLVRAAPNLTIRPARLTSELGISIEDASAELCGLMAVVGSTATFRFESIRDNVHDESQTDTLTMVFTFPQDFERRARYSRRTKDTKKALVRLMIICLKVSKIVVAFGLIISLAVVLVFGLCAAVALVLALSRNSGNDFGRRRATSTIRMLLRTLRELLWIFMVFGPSTEEGDDWRGAARTTLGLLYGPNSPWFWIQMGRWTRRTRTIPREAGAGEERRSWGGRSLNRRSLWLDDKKITSSNYAQSQPQSHSQVLTPKQGILSVAVEFLFGPTPFFPGPSERTKWQIRQRVLEALLSSNLDKIKARRAGVSLAQILPFVDHPPPSIQSSSSSSTTVSEALKTVSFFNGVPVRNNNTTINDSVVNNGGKPDHDMTQSFVFPELMSEEEAACDDGRLEEFLGKGKGLKIYNERDGGRQMWKSFFCTDANEVQGDGLEQVRLPTNETVGLVSPQLMYFEESKYVLTRLTHAQFSLCLLLNTINAIGIWIFCRSIEPGGLLAIRNPIGYAVIYRLLRFLGFYAKVFFALPLARMICIIWLNLRINKRNELRRALVKKHNEECSSLCTH